MGCINSKNRDKTHYEHNESSNISFVYKTPLHLQHNLSMANNSMCQDTDIPEKITWDDTIPFVVPVDAGRVIKVYDGDTITIASKLSSPDSPIYRFQVRLDGIDSPEMNAISKTEKQIAIIARDKLNEKLLGQWVELRNVSYEKYGRILAEVWCKADNGTMECINEWMLHNHLAVPYDGGTKHSPANWEKYYKSSI
jgi:endonuclease YncB( thermonuclease family)